MACCQSGWKWTIPPKKKLRADHSLYSDECVWIGIKWWFLLSNNLIIIIIIINENRTIITITLHISDFMVMAEKKMEKDMALNNTASSKWLLLLFYTEWFWCIISLAVLEGSLLQQGCEYILLKVKVSIAYSWREIFHIFICDTPFFFCIHLYII